MGKLIRTTQSLPVHPYERAASEHRGLRLMQTVRAVSLTRECLRSALGALPEGIEVCGSCRRCAQSPEIVGFWRTLVHGSFLPALDHRDQVQIGARAGHHLEADAGRLCFRDPMYSSGGCHATHPEVDIVLCSGCSRAPESSAMPSVSLAVDVWCLSRIRALGPRRFASLTTGSPGIPSPEDTRLRGRI